jgi:arylsulfatase A-like enzyme
MNRLITLALTGLLVSQAGSATASEPKPNILLLLSDDHSYPYLGCYGNPDVRTPHLDKLAGEGMRFDRMFVSCPQCVPSRAALMSGRSPVAVRMVRFTSPLPAEVVALPELLREQGGYFTGVGGRSYHLDGPPTRNASGVSVIGETLDRHDLRGFARRVDVVDKSGPMADFGGKLASFLDQVPPGKPWFYWLGFSDPHHPWQTKGPNAIPDAEKLTPPPHLPDLPGVRSDLARYLAEIEHLDADIQDVLDTLQRRGYSNNTIVVFLGDNGMAMPHGKGALHDPGIHVPLLVRWPGVVQPGGSTSALISGEDITPTLLEAAGITIPSPMSGLSFLPLLRGERFSGRAHIFAERGPHGGDGGMRPEISAATFDLSRCVRSDRFKLIYNCTPHQPVGPIDSRNDPGWREMVAAHAEGRLAPEFVQAYFTTPRPTFELYDLDADPGELRNLAGKPEYKDVEIALKRALTEKMVLDWDFLPTPLR